ncbi:MAG: hypothetical protein J6U36_08195, partial [Oscillospiraceae bacterium]|nr:hypothetical protein [Oscillospiraceae bacterium]
MKRQMAIIAVASTIALMLAGCDSSSAKPDQKNEKDAEITLIAKNEPVEEGEKEQEPSEQVEPEEQKSE